jgi:hypothetical protein
MFSAINLVEVSSTIFRFKHRRRSPVRATFRRSRTLDGKWRIIGKLGSILVWALTGDDSAVSIGTAAGTFTWPIAGHSRGGFGVIPCFEEPRIWINIRGSDRVHSVDSSSTSFRSLAVSGESHSRMFALMRDL